MRLGRALCWVAALCPYGLLAFAPPRAVSVGRALWTRAAPRGLDRDAAAAQGQGQQEAVGPGHSSSFPVSTARSGQLELGRLVLAIAVAWLTVKLQVQAVYDKVNNAKQRGGEQAPAEGAQLAIVDVGGGVKYQDFVLGTSTVSLGQTVQLSADVFYNGLELFSGSTKYKFGLEEAVAIKTKFPPYLAGLVGAMEGLRMDGKRQVAIQCDDGLEPYVPKGSTILCSISLSDPVSLL